MGAGLLGCWGIGCFKVICCPMDLGVFFSVGILSVELSRFLSCNEVYLTVHILLWLTGRLLESSINKSDIPHLSLKLYLKNKDIP